MTDTEFLKANRILPCRIAEPRHVAPFFVACLMVVGLVLLVDLYG